jgi:hypothetical protein
VYLQGFYGLQTSQVQKWGPRRPKIRQTTSTMFRL